MSRHTIAYGYRTRDDAADALEDMFASGEICLGERPEIHSYTTKAGKTRFLISALS